MKKPATTESLWSTFEPIFDKWFQIHSFNQEEVEKRQIQFVYEHFCPFALTIVERFGEQRLGGGTTIPAPPTDRYSIADFATALSGTPDVLFAGMRIIFWAAAAIDPTSCRRGLDSANLFNLLLNHMVIQICDTQKLTYRFVPHPETISWIGDAVLELDADSSKQEVNAKVRIPPRRVLLLGQLRATHPEASQQRLAEIMTSQGYDMVQGTVSRDLNHFREYFAEIGLGELAQVQKAVKEQAIDPKVIDRGKPQGGNKHRINRKAEDRE